ncbi:MAG: hypothetical protein QM715_20855 [Nibricoccus sp.]
MTLSDIINDIADQADDFLDGVTKRTDARAAISEQLTIKYPKLAGPERTKVTDGVLALLDEEGFFELGSGSGSDSDNEGGDSSEEE